MKDAKRGIALLVVLTVLFSVTAFVLPFPKNMVFWVAYACGIFAVMFQLYTFKSSFENADARSRFYGFPIARLGIYYLVIQLIISVAEIALSAFLPIWSVILLNVLILAFALIGCITAETMRDETVRQDNKLKKNISNMRKLQSITAALVNQCSDEGLKEDAKKLADEFCYSDPVSSDRTRELEVDLLTRIGDLQRAITDGDVEEAKALCGLLSAALRERNRVCAVNKK